MTKTPSQESLLFILGSEVMRAYEVNIQFPTGRNLMIFSWTSEREFSETEQLYFQTSLRMCLS
ncbi:hypothetical protein M758_5G099500 [Ceratodon purpureus]|nr:hypothetical protein M758_5G099500 [Ceratodon purpureus]